MLVLLTGAFGNLGRETARALIAHGHDVRATDLESKSARKHARELKRLATSRGRNIDVRFGDIRDTSRVKHALLGVDAVIHLAAILPPATEVNPTLTDDINVGAVETLVSAIETLKNPPALLFASSVSVYGPRLHATPPVTAETPTVATDVYTRTKLAAEATIRAARIPWTIFRVGVSPDPSGGQASAEIIRMLFEMSGENRVEYIAPASVARALARAVDCDAARGKVLLLGGGPGCRITHRDLLEVVFDALGFGRLPAEALGDESYYTDWMDTEEAEALLNFQGARFEDYRDLLRAKMRPLRAMPAPARRAARAAFLRLSRPYRERAR